MDKREHASVDIDKLANSLTEEFKTLNPSSQDCCIYRVHLPIRCLNPSDYTPQIVSIGPLHHGKKELKDMEEHKIRYLQHFLERTKISIGDFLALINDNEEKLRKCYANTFDLENEDFVRVILVDAVFLIEFFLRSCNRKLITNDDRIFGKPMTVNQMWCDLWLVENQIPLFIINDLFNLAKTYGEYYEGLSLTTITSWFRESVLQFVPIEKSLLETNFSEAKHFLDLLRLCLPPSQSSPTQTDQIQVQEIPSGTELLQPLLLSTQTEPHQPSQSPTQSIPSASELHQAGVKFKLGSDRNLLGITFKEGILEIPFITVYDNSERFYRNIIAFENMDGRTFGFNDYVIMMSYLANTAKDAELLIQNGIVGLGNGERLTTVFHSLRKDSCLDPNFQYSCLVKTLRRYCDDYPWHKWMASLKQDYFSNPWASISVIAAVYLLVLTTIQTVCSIIAL